VSRTRKSFRVVRACARCDCLVRTGPQGESENMVIAMLASWLICVAKWCLSAATVHHKSGAHIPHRLKNAIGALTASDSCSILPTSSTSTISSC
jgi:hypothetical protein